MTQHNLHEHVSWLLRTKPFVPPVRPVVQGDNLQSFDESLPASTPYESAKHALKKSSQLTVKQSQQSQPSIETAAPENSKFAAGATKADHDPSMARLRSTPSSAAKPPVPLHSSFPSYDGKSNLDQYRNRLSDVSAPRVVEPSAPLVAKSPSLTDQEWTDLDMLDLTGNLEESATVSEARNTKSVHGQKRKSEQYDEVDAIPDSEHTSSKQKTVSGPSCVSIVQDFAPTGDYTADDPPPPYSTTLLSVESVDERTYREAEIRAKARSPRENLKPAARLDNTLQISESSSPKRAKPVLKVLDSSKKPKALVSFTPESDSFTESLAISPSKRAKSKKRHIVADSEDEDDSNGAAVAESPHARKSPSLRKSPTALQIDHRSSPSPTENLTRKPQSKNSSPHRPKSHVKTGEPLKVRQQADPSPDDLTHVRNTLNMDESLLSVERTRIDRDLAEKKEIAYEYLSTACEVSPELQSQIKACKQRQSHLNRFIELREDNIRLNQRRKALKATLMDALENGLDEESHLSAVQKNSSVTKEIKALEIEVFQLLPSLASLTSGARLNNDGKAGEQGLSAKKDTSNGTLSKKQVKSDLARLQRSESPLIPGSDIREKQSPRKPQEVNRRKIPQSQDYTVDPTDAMDSITFLSVQATPEKSYNSKIGSDVGHFSTIMGTPPARRRQDHEWYGNEDDDDAEMLVAAQDLEESGEACTYYSQDSREILRESSGNRQSQLEATFGKGKLALFQKQLGQTSKQPADLYGYPWSKDVKALLRDRFRLKGFRNHQLEAINATLAAEDVFVLMPTGGGKSLCYQLPAIVQSGKTKGVTVVISPLLSLMEDQVQHMKEVGVLADMVTGESTNDHRRTIYNILDSANVEKYLELLYLTPEMISKSNAMVGCLSRLSDQGRLARIVIDEAHCVSQWGHDFRPDYKAIGEKRAVFKGVPMMALTATATENVKVDVMHNLQMTGCKPFSQSFNRPNLYYEVLPKRKAGETLESIAALIKGKYRNQSGIIYCLARATCERIAKELKDNYGIRAHHYHAGMESPEKKDVQKKWQKDTYQVIVATIAFGMGIDKSNVRFVIHHSVPKSLEGYYQETGRAGRDGKRSGCYLFYGYQDTRSILSMINSSEGNEEQKERQKHLLRCMVQYCENGSDCRREQVLSYFSERFSRRNCNKTCDNCSSNSAFDTIDVTEQVSAALRMVKALQNEQVTMTQLVSLMLGRKNKRVAGGELLKEFGIGASMNQRDVERLFRLLLVEEALSEENKVINPAKGFAVQYIRLGKRWRAYASKQQRVQIEVRALGQDEDGKKPAQKTKSRKKRKSEASASTEYPASTNVSSPIQAASKGRALQAKRAKKVSTSANSLLNGYSQDSFVVADDHPECNVDNRAGAQYSRGGIFDNDDDDDAFEPVRQVNKPLRKSRKQVGPPITVDQRMQELDETHQSVIEAFMTRAKKKSGDILMRKGLREQPFTDTILREMVIRFTLTEHDMLQIPGIDRERVRLHGKEFLSMIKESYMFYMGAMGKGGEAAPQRRAQMDEDDDDGRVYDPNHEIVNLVSDDDYGSLDDLDLEQSQTIQSTYFEPKAADLRARFTYTETPRAGTSSKASSRPGRVVKNTAAGSLHVPFNQDTDDDDDGDFMARESYQRKPTKSRSFKANGGSKKHGASNSHARSTKQKKSDGRVGIGMMPL